MNSVDESGNELDAEDILSTSLGTLYDYQPITHSSAGGILRVKLNHHLFPSPYPEETSAEITIRTPDTQVANWSLHASSVWVASVFLANHLDELELHRHIAHSPSGCIRLLELGAGAGLPGICVARLSLEIAVTLSDYPDGDLIQTLSENVSRNLVSSNCRVVPYAWGSDPAVLLRNNAFETEVASYSDVGYDVVLAADTLWNPELHPSFIRTLHLTLKRSQDARVHLVAGLHTGRYTIQSFLNSAKQCDFEIDSLEEREVAGNGRRDWDVSRVENEDERERRRWVIWIILRWKLDTVHQSS